MAEQFEINSDGLKIQGEFKAGSPMVVFSHGFGTERTSMGMFTDLAAALPASYGFIMFDYYHINGDIWKVPDIKTMILGLKDVIEFARKSAEKVTIVAHSQGCTIAALAETTEQCIFIAPPTRTISGPFKETFVKKRADRAKVDSSGHVHITRKRDGKKLSIDKGWFDQMIKNGALEKMKQIAKSGSLSIIEALEDEDIKDRRGYVTLEQNGAIKISVRADHNFTGNARSLLLKTVTAILAS